MLECNILIRRFRQKKSKYLGVELPELPKKAQKATKPVNLDEVEVSLHFEIVTCNFRTLINQSWERTKPVVLRIFVSCAK